MVDSIITKSSLNSVKITVVGNVDSGKSTLVGVLTKGEKDDGRGLARQKVFNFSHEQSSGRTTSVTQVSTTKHLFTEGNHGLFQR